MSEQTKPREDETYNEVEVLSLARMGDAGALGVLFEEHSQGVRRLLRSVMGPGVDIDDLTQDVFFAAFRSLPRFRGDSRFATWLHRLAVNTAINHMRKNKRRSKTFVPEAKAVTSDRDVNATHGGATQRDDVHGRAVAREMIRRFYEILDTVSPKRRAAFTLFEIENNSLADLSKILGVSKATAKSRVWFARREIMTKAKDDPVLGPLVEEMSR